MDILTFVASFVMLIALIILAGFDYNQHSYRLLFSTIRFIHVFYIINILYNFLFNWKAIFTGKRPFRLIIDTLVLITLLPLIYPHPENPWLPFLERILYSNIFNFIILGVYSMIVFCVGILSVLGRRTNPAVILGSSFFFFIILGSFLLMMPKCVNSQPLSYIDSLFISTSAVSITGLTSVDISTTFTPLGLLILAILIQIGGLGVLTFTSSFALFFSGNASIYSQIMVRDMVYTRTMNNLLPTLLYILMFTLTIEVVGAIVIFFSVHDTLGLPVEDEIIFSAFHSLTAFMNAGFSNIEGGLSNEALLHSNQSIYIIASVLILAGGIGFPILVNIKSAVSQYFKRLMNRIKKRQYEENPVHIYDINTKIVLYMTLMLYLVSAILFFILEHDNTLRGMSLYEQVVQSVFNAFVPRSSGFSSVSSTSFNNLTILMMIVLMIIGGASQSTAGGVKVNTVAAVFLNLKAVILGRNDVVTFGRRISVNSIRRAQAVLALAIVTLIIYTATIMALEPELPVKALVFETVSALFTVGSSLGITPQLGVASKIVLCTAMFIGRVGLLSLLMGFTYSVKNRQVKYPTGDIIIN
ncbi:MAG: hypothetical protein NC082_06195 [Clostridiales bacterium]|nr:hypothetical protein [Clostridiales bacterium]